MGAAVDAEFRCEQTDGFLTVTCTRMKEAAPGPPLYFRGRTVDLGYRDNAGNPVSTMELERASQDDQDDGAELTELQKKVMEKLRAMLSQQQQTLSESGFPVENALVLATDLVEQCSDARIVRPNDMPSIRRKYSREAMVSAMQNKGGNVVDSLDVKLP